MLQNLFVYTKFILLNTFQISNFHLLMRYDSQFTGKYIYKKIYKNIFNTQSERRELNE